MQLEGVKSRGSVSAHVQNDGIYGDGSRADAHTPPSNMHKSLTPSLPFSYHISCVCSRLQIITESSLANEAYPSISITSIINLSLKNKTNNFRYKIWSVLVQYLTLEACFRVSQSSSDLNLKFIFKILY